MFCRNCGKALPDGAKFCDGCGAKIDDAGVAPPAQPGARSNPIFTDTWNTVKGFFSKNTVKTVGDAAKSTGLEWIILESVSALLCGFAFALNARKLFGTLSSLMGMAGERLPGKFGLWLLSGMALSVITFFVTAFCVYGAVKLVFKKQVNVICALNLTAAASIPMSVAFVLNMIFGSMWYPFVIFFTAVGAIATFVLLYAGLRELAESENSPFIAYIVITAVIIAVMFLFAFLLISGVVRSMFASLW